MSFAKQQADQMDTPRDVSISYHLRDGSRTLHVHRVWDMDLFIAALNKRVAESRDNKQEAPSDVVRWVHLN